MAQAIRLFENQTRRDGERELVAVSCEMLGGGGAHQNVVSFYSVLAQLAEWRPVTPTDPGSSPGDGAGRVHVLARVIVG